MVQRTDMYGDIVEEDEGNVINITPFNKPILLIFLNYNKSLMNQLSGLPKVFLCKPNKIEVFTNHCYHMMAYISAEDFQNQIRQLSNISQRIVAINLLGDIKLSDNIHQLSFDGYDDDFIYEYLKEFLR